LFTVPKGLVRILDRDLKLAGIAKRDERGRTLDVHALRHTFGTLLSKGGVTPRTAQAAMRHSTIDLTMNVYTDPKLLDVHGAMDSLPAMPLNNGHRPTREVVKATGTDDQPASTLAPVLARKSDISCKTVSNADRSPLREASRSESLPFDVTSILVRGSDSPISGVIGCQESGRQDLNLRPSGPKPDALARLSYAPKVVRFSLGARAMAVNAGSEPRAGVAASPLGLVEDADSRSVDFSPHESRSVGQVDVAAAFSTQPTYERVSVTWGLKSPLRSLAAIAARASPIPSEHVNWRQRVVIVACDLCPSTDCPCSAFSTKTTIASRSSSRRES
jgi:hypothetical protein